MSSDMLGLIELLFVFGSVFVFGWWQLRSLKKREQRLKEAADKRDSLETDE